MYGAQNRCRPKAPAPRRRSFEPALGVARELPDEDPPSGEHGDYGDHAQDPDRPRFTPNDQDGRLRRADRKPGNPRQHREARSNRRWEARLDEEEERKKQHEERFAVTHAEHVRGWVEGEEEHRPQGDALVEALGEES